MSGNKGNSKRTLGDYIAEQTPDTILEENEDMAINNLDEDTPAAGTLHPGSGSAGAGDSKAVMLDTFVSLLAKLGKEDLSKFFNDSIAQIGHEADPIPGGASAKNKNSIATKSTVKEAVDEMFEGDDLSEEFRGKASVIFEAALNSRITIETTRLEEEFAAMAEEMAEEFEAELQEQAESMFEEVATKLDQYLDHVVNEWMTVNELAVENSLRADIAEDFMVGLQNLFTEHYINVPTDRLDVFGEMKSEIETLKAKLNEAVDEQLALQSIINEATKESLLDEVSEGLVVTQSEKLRTLSEGIEYSDAESYRKKLEIVKENYFTKSNKVSASSGLITESIDGTDVDVERPLGGAMNKYVSQISKSVK